MIVRIFGFEGMEQLPIHLPQQYTGDSVFQLMQPYLWRDHLTTNGLTPVSSATVSLAATRILRIEVPDGQSIRYEINPPNRGGGVVPADQYSQILSGANNFYFRGGWGLSVIDASGT